MNAVHRGFEIENYYSSDHPIQREIISTLARFSDTDENMPVAIDGCSAPTFGMPLHSLAVAFARLVSSSGNDADAQPASYKLDSALTEAAKRVVAAMIRYPEMIGGTKGRFDTELLRAGRGKLICKIGAEAVYSVGVLPCERFPRGLGIALKMEDGSYRGLGPVVVEILAQLGVLSESELEELADYHRPAIENRRGLKVGEVRAVFDLR